MEVPRKTLWVVWGCLVVALGVYLWLGFFLDGGPAEGEEQEVGARVLLLGMFGFFCGGLSFVVKAVLRGVLAKLAAREAETDAATVAAFTVAFAMAVWALAEAPAVFGLVLYLTGETREVLVGFWVVSAVLMVWHWPGAVVSEKLKS